MSELPAVEGRTESTSTPSVEDIEAFEDRLDAAVESGSREGLEVVGYGEVSVAVRLATSHGDFVCKRMVPFATRGDAEHAAALVHVYVERLGNCGVDVVPTSTMIIERPDGPVLYCVQPLLAPGTLGPDFVRGKGVDEVEPYIARIFQHIRDSVSPALAPDGQLSNWAVDGERIRYLDVGTPFMKDDEGRSLFDFRQQTRALPQPIRFIVNRFMLDGILENYHSTRGQALDFLGNLIKEGLGDLLVPLLPVANRVFALDPPITEAQVRAHYKSDAQSYALIQATRRADRWFHRTILRKPYPFLLPPRIDRFG